MRMVKFWCWLFHDRLWTREHSGAADIVRCPKCRTAWFESNIL